MSTDETSFFLKTAWQLAWPDLKSHFKQAWLVVIDLIITFVVVWPVLIALAPNEVNSWKEQAALGVVAVIGLLVFRVLWSFVKVPWKLYCDLASKVNVLSSEVGTIKQGRLEVPQVTPAPPNGVTGDRLTQVQLMLLWQADEAPVDHQKYSKEESRDWMRVTYPMLQESVRQEARRKFRWSTNAQLPQPQLKEAQGILRTIASNLTHRDLT